jgi:uncharacterized membrane protein
MPHQFRSVHIRAVTGWRALVVGGLVMAAFAALAFLTFGLFLLLLPLTIAAALASLFLPRARTDSIRRTGRRAGNMIEGDYKVVSEEKIAFDEKSDDRSP